jgi:calcium/calmodulin-dependent protein kinase I
MLSGYPPFERDTDLEEMQAILVADYAFEPKEVWDQVSASAKEFIQRCLTVDPVHRITTHEALSHPWITGEGQEGGKMDLLPAIKKNFNARRTLHAAIDTIRAINQLRAGGAAMGMPPPKQQNGEQGGPPKTNGASEPMEGVEMTGQAQSEKELDPRGNARGQTDEQIEQQQSKISAVMQKTRAAVERMV